MKAQVPLPPLALVPSRQYRKDVRLVARQGRNLSELDAVVVLLANRVPLPERYRDHPLHGDREGFRDCHIRPDWVLVYRVREERLELLLSRTGTHSELRMD